MEVCEKCGNPPDWRGLRTHHDPPKGMGGNPNWKGRLWRLCGKCHSKEHHIIEVDSDPQWSKR